MFSLCSQNMPTSPRWQSVLFCPSAACGGVGAYLLFRSAHLLGLQLTLACGAWHCTLSFWWSCLVSLYWYPDWCLSSSSRFCYHSEGWWLRHYLARPWAWPVGAMVAGTLRLCHLILLASQRATRPRCWCLYSMSVLLPIFVCLKALLLSQRLHLVP